MATTGGQWASGRKLTKEQRERKRAVDRMRSNKNQRQNASRIARLESRLQEVTAELQALKETKAVQAMATGIENPQGQHWLNASSKSRPFLQPTISTDMWCESTSIPVLPITQPALWSTAMSTSETGLQADKSLVTDARSSITERSSFPSYDAGLLQPAAVTRGLSGFVPASADGPSGKRAITVSCKEVFHTALCEASSLSQSTICTDMILNQDALIRGILLTGKMCPAQPLSTVRYGQYYNTSTQGSFD